MATSSSGRLRWLGGEGSTQSSTHRPVSCRTRSARCPSLREEWRKSHSRVGIAGAANQRCLGHRARVARNRQQPRCLARPGDQGPQQGRRQVQGAPPKPGSRFGCSPVQLAQQMGRVTVELEGRTVEREPTVPEQFGALLGDGAVTQLPGVEAVTAPELPVRADPGWAPRSSWIPSHRARISSYTLLTSLIRRVRNPRTGRGSPKMRPWSWKRTVARTAPCSLSRSAQKSRSARKSCGSQSARRTSLMPTTEAG